MQGVDDDMKTRASWAYGSSVRLSPEAAQGSSQPCEDMTGEQEIGRDAKENGSKTFPQSQHLHQFVPRLPPRNSPLGRSGSVPSACAQSSQEA